MIQYGDFPTYATVGALARKMRKITDFVLERCKPQSLDPKHPYRSQDGWTAQIFRNDGTLHPGPRREPWFAFSKHDLRF